MVEVASEQTLISTTKIFLKLNIESPFLHYCLIKDLRYKISIPHPYLQEKID